MGNILLSNESYNLLKEFYSGNNPDLSCPDFQPQIDQLVEQGLIESKVIDYDISENFVRPVWSEYQITEFGKGFIVCHEADAELVRSISEIAASAKAQAASALKKSRKASVAGIISLAVSISMLLVSAISSYDKIIAFLNALFTSS